MTASKAGASRGGASVTVTGAEVERAFKVNGSTDLEIARVALSFAQLRACQRKEAVTLYVRLSDGEVVFRVERDEQGVVSTFTTSKEVQR